MKMETLTDRELTEMGTSLLKRIDLANEVPPMEAIKTPSQFQLVLKNKIQEWITYDLEMLMQILYRLDVPESEINQAFEVHSVGSIAEIITNSIIKREIKRYKLKREMSL